MPEAFPHSEQILQYIWQHLLFEIRDLQTTAGKRVELTDAGKLNLTDGPDFIHATIHIDGMEWHGAVEMHVHSSGWKQHGHHTDPAYNQVILHVVAEDTRIDVKREDGTSVPTLNLLPYLNAEAVNFLSALNFSDTIPCSGNLSYISAKALSEQIQKAHFEYFEQKVEDLLRFYDPELLPVTAWKQSLMLAVWDGFGIPHNRKGMISAGRQYLQQIQQVEDGAQPDAGLFAEKIIAAHSGIPWGHRGVHPVSQPRNAIRNAYTLCERIRIHPFKDLLIHANTGSWEAWVKDAGIQAYYKSGILKATVFMPAMYLLGSLFHSQNLMGQARTEWSRYRIPLPKSLQRQLRAFGEKEGRRYNSTLGAVHQLRAYCERRRCHECEVLKKVISS